MRGTHQHPAPGAVSPPRLELAALAKTYGAVRALQNASLTVQPGEIHALCGHNGAGKSTLVKILAGLVEPDAGSVKIDGKHVTAKNAWQAQRAGVAIVDQEISLVDALSVADNVLLGLLDAPFLQRRRRSMAYVSGLLKHVGLGALSPEQPVGSLTLGERQLVEVARALGRDPSVLILDEPTATLSEAEAGEVFAAIRAIAAHGSSVLFVSHRLGEVLSLCDRATVMRDGRIVATEPVANLSRDRLINLMVGEVREHRSVAPRFPAGGPAVRLQGVAAPPRLQPVDLEIAPGEIVALAGQVGSGATEVLRAVAGLVPGARGGVAVGGRSVPLVSPRRSAAAGIRYIANDRKSEGLFLQRTVRVNLVATRLDDLDRGGSLGRRAIESAGDELAALVGLRRRGGTVAAELSGGNQQKAFVGRCLKHPSATLVLMDEPTRGVDVAGRAEIHDLIRRVAANGTPVLFASTELDEILDVAHRVVSLYRGAIVAVRPRSQATAAQLLAEMTHAGAAA